MNVRTFFARVIRPPRCSCCIGNDIATATTSYRLCPLHGNQNLSPRGATPPASPGPVAATAPSRRQGQSFCHWMIDCTWPLSGRKLCAAHREMRLDDR